MLSFEPTTSLYCSLQDNNHVGHLIIVSLNQQKKVNNKDGWKLHID